MKILALLTPAPGKTPADFGPHVVAEEKAVWAAYRTGKIRELYFQPDPLTVSLVFEAASQDDVNKVLQTFPMIEAGLLDIRMVVLGPWTMFEALFDPKHAVARIAVIGAGNIGANAARHFVEAGHEVRIAASGDVAKLTATATEIGAVPASVTDAVRASEIVMLAMPWIARGAVFAAAGDAAFAGKLVIDATNPYLAYPNVEDLGGRTSSAVIAQALPGAHIVKALNTLYADKLARGGLPKGAPDRIALPVSGDDAASVATVIGLLDDIGFDAVDAGPLASSRKQEPEQPFYARSDNLAQVKAMLAQPEFVK